MQIHAIQTGFVRIKAIATPGHTADHISVVVRDGDTIFFLAGDTSYNEELMLAGKVDGISADEQISIATLHNIKRLAQADPMVYLPTHDPDSGARLANRRLAGKCANGKGSNR
jgi:N-acyl homoserine lactone hydrolase